MLEAKNAVINVSNLTKNFKDFTLNIEKLHIPKGFSTALIGENGAGKSTFINILAGVRLDYNGTIDYFNGETDEYVIREKIGYVSPTNYYMPHWTINQVSSATELLFNGFHKDRFDAWLDELGVNDSGKNKNKKISKLSDGTKMKVMLSGVFARDTEFLLLDEPASPLDPLMRDKLCNMIQNYIDEGDGKRSVLFSTHNIADMENVTDYAIIMENGAVVEQGFVENLKEKYVLIKGEAEDAAKAQQILYSISKNAYGFEGLCLSDKLEQLAGMDITTEIPTLSQISVAVMKQYSKLTD